MGKYDGLYDAFQKIEEERQRKNFDIFMNSLTDGLVEELDAKYAGEKTEGCSYDQLVENIKKRGFRVFRNSEGKHKVAI